MGIMSSGQAINVTAPHPVVAAGALICLVGSLPAVGAKASCNRVDFEGKGGVRAGGSWRATDACGEAGAKVDAQHASSRSG